MHKSDPIKKLSLSNEVLKARIEIHDYFIQTVIRDIYENIGQTLSLVHMQLGTVAMTGGNTFAKLLMDSSNSLGQSIRDLRKMAKQLYPEAYLQSEKGWHEAITYVIQSSDVNVEAVLKISGTPMEITAELKLLLLNIIQKILFYLRSKDIKSAALGLTYSSSSISFTAEYKGGGTYHNKAMHDDDIKSDSTAPDLYTLAALIQGKYSERILKGKRNRISLSVPLTLPTYEK